MKKILAFIISFNILSSDKFTQMVEQVSDRLYSQNLQERSDSLMILFCTIPDYIKSLKIIYAQENTLQYLGVYLSPLNKSKDKKVIDDLFEHFQTGNFVLDPKNNIDSEVLFIVGRSTIPTIYEYSSMRFPDNTTVLQKALQGCS